LYWPLHGDTSGNSRAQFLLSGFISAENDPLLSIRIGEMHVNVLV
jgi:hypothetical protein